MEVPPAQKIEFDSISDMIRLLISSAHERGIANLFAYVHEGKTTFFITQVLPGFYEYRGLPLTAFYTYDKEVRESFVAYKATEEGEEWEFTNGLKTPGFQIIPIIRVKTPPKFMLDL